MANKRGGGLLFGVIVGTMLGVLFAPKKGKDLRKELKDEVEKGGIGTETLKKNFVEMGHDMATTAEEVYIQPEVQNVVRKGKKQVNKMMLGAEGRVENAQQQVKNLGEKYLDLDDKKIKEVSKKLSTASKKIKGKLQTVHQNLMNNMGFTKKAISQKSSNSKSEKQETPPSKKRRTKKVNIKKQEN